MGFGTACESSRRRVPIPPQNRTTFIRPHRPRAASDRAAPAGARLSPLCQPHPPGAHFRARADRRQALSGISRTAWLVQVIPEVERLCQATARGFDGRRSCLSLAVARGSTHGHLGCSCRRAPHSPEIAGCLGREWLVAGPDTATWAGAMKVLLDRNACDRGSQLARAASQRHFTPSRGLMALEDCYERAVSSFRAR